MAVESTFSESGSRSLWPGRTALLVLALCFVLIPRLGVEGAAVSTATAIIVESICLYYVARRRLGMHVFILGRKKST